MALRLKRHNVKGHGFKPIPNPTAEPQFYSYSQVGDESIENNARMQPISSKERKTSRSKKNIVMSRAKKQAEAVQLEDHISLPAKITNEEHSTCANKNDCLFLAPAFDGSNVPPAATFPDTASSANTHRRSLDSKLVSTNPEARDNSQDLLKKDDVATLHSRPGALSAANAPPPATFFAQAPTQVAMINDSSKYTAALMRMSGMNNNRLLPQCYTQPKVDDFFSQRIAQLHREEKEIKMLRAQMMGTLPPQFFQTTSSSESYGNSSSLVAGIVPSVSTRASESTSVAQAIREANLYEELAKASLNKARILALSGAMDPDMGSK